ncbi:BRCA1-associated protein [Belonocnema kinseyi]|uniref:BRCA1-associated protein n=1 Tax=Belonocnema kinseyi TaxID=2817044 RepID=UPI00143D68D3|nr:BRCA1-associated protein [Belonocnema kinseyi]
MTSSEILVSLCVIRIEVSDPDSEESVAAMAVRKMRGCREPRNITIENYSSAEEGPTPLLPQSLNKSHSTSRLSPEDAVSSISQNPAPEGAASCNVPDQISFFSGNPFVEVTKGILHLFKEDELTAVKSAATRSNTICMLSVPANMTCHDLLQFTAACHENIQHFRILRDDNPDQYMALITFRNSAPASEFYETYNGAPYNSLEPDAVCHLVFVSNVEVGDNGMPIAGHTELPSCPVCLERMDESVDGILTVLCNHTFHASCLVKWGDTSCPICRYAQTPEPLGDSNCMECGGTNTELIALCAYARFFLFQKKISTLNKEKQTLEKKIQNITHKLSQSQSELSEEKALRKSLQLNQTSWQTKHKQLQDELAQYKTGKESELTDLKEQLRDVMFFLEAQKQIENSADREEIAAGRILIGPDAKTSKNSSTRSSRRQSKR